MPFVTTQDGTEIYYKDWGTGVPVVLIHGWPLNADMWEHQAVFLASKGFRVISYDRRGFGRSSQPWTGYDYDTLADDLSAVMEKLDLKGAALVGFSMGGGEVLRYLSRHGAGRVSKAVLLAASPPLMVKTADHPEGIDESMFEGLIDSMTKDRPHFMQEFAHKFYGRTLLKHTVTEAVLDWTFGMAMQGSPKATVDCVAAFSATDFRKEMAAITVETLVIHGTADVTVPIELSGRRSAKLLPNARLLEYEGEPHGLFLTAADRLNEDLWTFLRVGSVETL